ncbi:MAG: NADH-quinone oxidoreductase subunit C [Phycisphaeraceae bacterium]|nr:NADH-quinone oxidoreductase subunit C [Phycisphaeraceae bacterium]
MVTCEDRRESEQAMRLVYTFNRFDAADRHAVFVTIPGDIPGAEAPSIANVCAAADWLEREVYDMYGVRFTGHPDCKRILLPEDADFHALLKDFGRLEDAPENQQAAAAGGES